MSLNDDKAALLRYDFQAMFDPALEASYAQAKYEILTMAQDQSKPHVQHNWMWGAPGMSEWLDERPMSKLIHEKFLVSSKNWANGLEVDQNDIEDENTVAYGKQIAMLANRAALHYDSLAFQYLAAGFGTTLGACFDGKALFATDHILGDQAISNKGTAELADTGAIDGAFEAMYKLVDANGDPMEGVEPSHIIVGPSNVAEAKRQIERLNDSNGASNIHYKALQIIVNRRFVGSAAKYWCVADLTKPIKPIGIDILKRPVFESVTVSLDRFKRRKYYYGCEARHNAYYGWFPYIYGSDGTS